MAVSRCWKHDENGRLYEGRQRIGEGQLSVLAMFREPGLFEPTREGKPWKSMRRLVDLGLMFVHCERVSIWGFDGAEWSSEKLRWRAGLTEWGKQALANQSDRREG